MALNAGSRLGPYEILTPLGAGGMGEVYKARDTRLERAVAVKVLPSHFSQNDEVRLRFEREARTISSLSHPYICALYDVGHQDGVDFLVMEYLEGESLAERLAKGRLSVDQTLRWGEEIAAALDAAHRHGIVHRDLKPGNVMLTKSGVKLLDFGLAKLLKTPGSVDSLTSAPTEAKDLTSEGAILGTVAYMAPEQIEGKSADQRTDIFALGAVLYEMATGRKAFTGTSRVSLIGSILKDEPALISSIQPMAPPALDRLVQTCLAKDPDDRLQAAHDVELQLQWIAEGGSQASAHAVVVSPRKSRERVAWALVALMTLALAASLVSLLSTSRQPLSAVRASMLPPEKSAFVFDSGAMALSPDGARLAFVASTPNGKNLLWVRHLSSILAEPLAGTEDASFPFWSPDSRYLGFFAAGTLKRIDASGGPAQTVCIARNGRGGTWNREGVIVFSPSGRGSLMRVSSAGATPAPLAELDASKEEFSHRFPFFLPDGRHYLYLAVAGTGSDMIYVGKLDSKERKFLVRVNSNAIYAPSSAGSSRGYLLFSRQRTLVAQPFEPNSLSVTGEAVSIGESVSFFDNTGLAAFTASSTGTLAYQPAGMGALSQLIWFDRAGRQLDVVGAPADYRRIRLSHEGRRIAVDIYDPQTDHTDLWVIDVLRRGSTRLTFGPRDNLYPVWSPDDSKIAFRCDSHFGEVHQKTSSGTGEDELLVSSEKGVQDPTDWSLDGRFLTYSAVGTQAKASWDIFTFSITERKKVAFLTTPAEEYSSVFSPSVRWLAYVSEESGKAQVYVQPFPPAGGKWQVSTAGGVQPAWSRDGKQIFFVAPDNSLMAVDVRTSPGFEAGAPQVLFETHIKTEGGRSPGRRYDVSADGRFLINTATAEAKANPITLVQNWAAELKK